jgi:predicted MFS family arabinose efflux permease
VLTVLRNRNFALYWAAGTVNALGDYVLIVSLPFYIYRTSGSALLTGLMFMVQMLPPILLGSVAGVYVDRWNRKQTLAVADVTLALVLLPLLAIHGGSLTWIAVIVAFMEAAVFQFVPPAAGALLTAVVEPDRLAEANAVRSTGFNAAVLVGPPLGALLLESAGLSGVVLVDAGSYALAGLMVTGMRVQCLFDGENSTQRPRIPHFWAEWVGGLKVVRSTPTVAALFCIEGVGNVGSGIVWLTLIVFITGSLHAGTPAYGWWLSLNAVGGLAGSVIAAFLAKRVSPVLLIPMAATVQGLLWFPIVMTSSLRVLLVLSPVAAVVGVTWTVCASTVMQRDTDQPYLGRVLGSYGALASLSVLVGLAVASVLGGRVDARVLLGAAGALGILAAGSFLLIILRRRAGQEHVTIPTQ